MSDNYSLIIKNGFCYIDGKLIKTDLALLGNKIKIRVMKKTTTPFLFSLSALNVFLSIISKSLNIVYLNILL